MEQTTKQNMIDKLDLFIINLIDSYEGRIQNGETVSYEELSALGKLGMVSADIQHAINRQACK